MTITPEQARNLPYDNYTTPWALIEDAVFDGRGDYEQAWHAGPATVYDEDLVPLVAAAPIMAAQIAGMRWEYVIQQAPQDKEIWATFTNRIAWSPEALQDDLHEMQERFPEYRHRIARRLVGKPEEIS